MAAAEPAIPAVEPAARYSTRSATQIEREAAEAAAAAAEKAAEALEEQLGAEYLVEKVLAERPINKSNKGTGHDACWKRKGSKQYKVSWAPSGGKIWGDEYDSWVCGVCSIEPSLVGPGSDYARAKAEDAVAAKAAKAAVAAEAAEAAEVEASAGAQEREAAEQIAAAEAAEAALEAAASKRARVARPAASVASRRRQGAGKTASELSSAATGDFCMSESARKTLEEIKGCANNLKQFQYTEKKRTTAGGLFLVSACGLFLGMRELYGSESLTQVMLFLVDMFVEQRVPPPSVLAYDDGCHLLKFTQCREGEGSKFASWLLKTMKIVVDRFHFPNHKDTKFCAKYVDPSKCAELGPRTNTEAAEQAFAFLARSKHIFRHMNEARFTFTILRLLELRNRDKCRRHRERRRRQSD